MYFNPQVVVREKAKPTSEVVITLEESGPASKFAFEQIQSTKTTIPFVKNNEFDYSSLLS